MKPEIIVNELEHAVGQSGSARQLRDSIEKILLTRFNQPETKAAELSEALCEKVAKEIESREAAAAEFGTISIVSVINKRKVVHGSSLIFPKDDSSTISIKTSRLHSRDILSTIRALSFQEFEIFGGAVLRELGCLFPKVTRHSNDQGIDFFGEISVGQILGEQPNTKRLMHSARTVIVGQAKHYPDREIGPDKIRELVGALSLARTSTFSKSGLDLLDEIDLQPYTPALAVLFSTGDFSSGARHLADEAGIVLYSGTQLAVFLADCQIGINNEGDKSKFVKKDFYTWMNSQN